LKSQSLQEGNKCAVQPMVNEDIDGCKFSSFLTPTLFSYLSRDEMTLFISREC